MATNIPTVNSADTLSLFFRPGEDKRLFNTNSDSIFTFGDFKIYRDNTPDSLTGTNLNLSFDSFSTMESMGSANFTPPQSYSVNYNELNLVANDPFSYSYFGSFYVEVANSINHIIENFPYAILAFDGYTGNTIYDYSTVFNNITGEKRATFKIPYSCLKNQGNIIVNSGSTSINALSLIDNMTGFSIQMSAQTSASTKVVNIVSYEFSAGTNSYLQFTIDDFLEYVTSTASVFPVYIRPTRQRMAEYNMSIEKLEYNILYGQKLMVPDVDDTGETEQTFVWPTTIDGFSPDSYGVSFEGYKSKILKAAADTDDAKTNIMLKTMIPENFLDMDSQNAIYRSTVQAFAHEFDEIKHYIDGIAYAHSLQYNGEESLPKKFMFKFSNLLGWKLSDSFSEVDLFEYLAGDVDGNGNSYSYFNIEIWRRILLNINWLYKKKGTRDALQFIFKLLGAPECLIDFSEFVYKIQNISQNVNTGLTDSIKVNSDGYVNYDQSLYAFQEGGQGRGNGQNYIFQWSPEFAPIKTEDNIKSYPGDSSVFGSEDTINTKEITLSLDPATAIECDVYKFYQQTGTCWDWGSIYPPFSANTVPFEYSIDCDTVSPENMSGMTFYQWLNYVYTNSIDPRNRKVVGSPLTMYIYPQLRNAYLNYYFWANPASHRLTFSRIQGYLNLIEGSFNDYTMQLIPATTILETQGTVIRNTVFNRQKFVYKAGINDGSEFKVRLTPNLTNSITPIIINSVINDYHQCIISPVTVIGTLERGHSANVSAVSISAQILVQIHAPIHAVNVTGTIRRGRSLIKVTTSPIGLPGVVTSSH